MKHKSISLLGHLAKSRATGGSKTVPAQKPVATFAVLVGNVFDRGAHSYRPVWYRRVLCPCGQAPSARWRRRMIGDDARPEFIRCSIGCCQTTAAAPAAFMRRAGPDRVAWDSGCAAGRRSHAYARRGSRRPLDHRRVVPVPRCVAIPFCASPVRRRWRCAQAATLTSTDRYSPMVHAAGQSPACAARARSSTSGLRAPSSANHPETVRAISWPDTWTVRPCRRSLTR